MNYALEICYRSNPRIFSFPLYFILIISQKEEFIMYKEPLPASTQDIVRGCQEFFASKAKNKPFSHSYFQAKPEYTVCLTGAKVPFANAVWRHQSLNEKETHHVIDLFEKQEMPFLWWDPPTSVHSHSLNSLLIQRGLQFSGYLKGVITSTHQKSASALPGNLTIRKVENSQDLKTFCLCIFSLFDLPSELIDQLYQVMSQPLKDNQEVHYLAYDGQTPVGGITVSMNQMASIWNFMTHPNYQTQGLETALMLTALATAKQKGYAQAMAMFMPGEELLWNVCGWQEICQFPFYMHSGSISAKVPDQLIF